jgi:hypothetical protein
MPVELSASKQQQPPVTVSTGQRLAMVAMGYIPFVHCSLVVYLLGASLYGWALPGVFEGWGPISFLVCGIAILYLLPPLAILPLRIRHRLTDTKYPLESAEFLRWWYVAQWQVVFNRLPLLEEVLRLIPGAYSLWLRLWGASIGAFVYWSPGMRIFDRPFVEIGDRVAIGIDTKLYSHFLSRSTSGTTDLYLAPIAIGNDALIGGCGLLTAGVRVAACEQTPSVRPLAPFSHFEDGRSSRTIRFNEGQEHDA